MTGLSVDVRALIVEPRDALETLMIRRALAVSVALAAAGYYARSLFISEIVLGPLVGGPAYLLANAGVALGWAALVVTLVFLGARATGACGATWVELFGLWGFTQVPGLAIVLVTALLALIAPRGEGPGLGPVIVLPVLAGVVALSLWGLLLKLYAVRVWTGRTGWALGRTVLVVMVLYGAVEGVEYSIVAERGLVPRNALAAMEPAIDTLAVLPQSASVIFDKLTYRVRVPERGDVVAFAPIAPDGGFWPGLARTRIRYVGRIVGEPGERVTIEDGRVSVNGRAMAEAYPTELGALSVPETTLEEGQYFVLGDNRRVPLAAYEGGVVGADRLRGRLTELGMTRWAFLVGKGRW